MITADNRTYRENLQATRGLIPLKDQQITITPPHFLLKSDFLEIKKRLPTAKKHKLKKPWLIVIKEMSRFMSKLSLAGLICGLMLIGILFFGVGYLAAVATYGNSKPAVENQASWADTNKEKAGKGTPSPLDKLGSGIASDLIKKQTAAIGAKVGLGKLGDLTQHAVPGPLKPFAASAQNKATITAQSNINAIGNRLQRMASPARDSAPYKRQNDLQRPLSPQAQIRAQLPQSGASPGRQAPKVTPFGTPVPQAYGQAQPGPSLSQAYQPAYPQGAPPIYGPAPLYRNN